MDSRISKELQRKIFELTLALYRVTDFFPQGEPIRRHLRERANDIFGGASEYIHSLDCERDVISILGKIDSLKGYLNIARSMRFVKPINLTVLEREYDMVASFFTKELESLQKAQQKSAETSYKVSKETPFEPAQKDLPTWNEFTQKESNQPGEVNPVRSKPPQAAAVVPLAGRTSNGMNDRQKKIIEYIRTVNQAKISDFFTFFTDISSKTIQRDLQDLVVKNVLKKEGDKRWTIYSLNSALPR